MKDMTEIVCIIDRSGSMADKEEDVIGGFNTFLDEQKAVDKPAKLTYVQFDHAYEIVHDGRNIKDVPKLKNGDYMPRGSTALLDAIGRTFNTVGERLHKISEHDRPDKVIVVIITDGHENSSKEFTFKQIKKMVEIQRDAYKWEILFMGAGMDAIGAAGNMGIDTSRAYNVSDTGKGYRAAARFMSQNVSSHRRNREVLSASSLAENAIPEDYEGE